MKHLHFDLSCAKDEVMDEIAFDVAALGKGDAQELCLQWQKIVEKTIGFVDMGVCRRPALEGRGGPDVIDVRMGVDDRDDARSVIFEPGTYVVEIATRIDDDGPSGLVVDEDRAIASKGTDREGLDDHWFLVARCAKPLASRRW
jgi:hypothetical protein